MQLIFDNLIALLVGTVVLVILLGLTTDWTTENRDRTRQHMTREQQRVLAEMFERDVLNIGANVPVGDPILVANTDSLFSFYGAVNGSGVARLIEYKLKAEMQADSTTLYRIDRHIDGAYSGGTQAVLNWFEVKLLKPDPSDPTKDVLATDPSFSDARKVKIRFQATLPYKSNNEDASLRVTNWETIYQPSLLNR